MAAITELTPLFIDVPGHAGLGAVLRWCDASQVELYHAMPNEVHGKEFAELWATCAVMRTNVVEMLVQDKTWEKALAGDATNRVKVRVAQSVMRVGRTSWGVFSEITTTGGVQLARVNTVMVALDAESVSKPIPLPHPEGLKALIRECPPIQEPPTVCARPQGVFVWRAQVRHSDCDGFGHMNNAVYGDLMEDARRAAVAAGAFQGLPAAAGSAHLTSIEYLKEVKPLEEISLAVWWDGTVQAFGLELELPLEGVVARGV
eukprot:CAMPEP_0180646724 /NCGR_PEP_ID=MMETSP1037_2-20121125/49842_1 /TAXON_ID=632150 /ORGANISM="Azadinium spinosum, Strain 3D9" /LENGTH=259 /DNA_ID=CAMNT_0022671001 /DNA_START=41 /DNA_END=816 /DNA_ORIENTATION=-